MNNEISSSADQQNRYEGVDYRPNPVERVINGVTSPIRNAFSWLLAPRPGSVGLAPQSAEPSMIPGMADDPKPAMGASEAPKQLAA